MEVEKKFLLKTDGWRDLTNGVTKDIRQTYIVNTKDMIVRIGASVHKEDQEEVDRKAYLTIKTPREGLVRQETETELDHLDAVSMIIHATDNGCPLISKTRHHIEYGELVWEIDEFPDGLVVAEIELPHANYNIVLPPWVGIEVTHDPKYYNANMARGSK
jgi:CYTH domain-containing protein